MTAYKNVDANANKYSKIYIDTYFFQGYLWGKEDEKENANVILSKIKSNVRRNPEINVKILFILLEK